MWTVVVCAVSVVYFQDTLVKYQPRYHPGVWGFNGTKEGWIDSRDSLTFDTQGNVVSMRKCPLEQYLTPAERREIFLVYIAWCVVIFLTHAGILMVMLGY